jgi:DNA-binding NarL/FixJ family response regulator
VVELRAQGWSWAKIADEMSLELGTVDPAGQAGLVDA